MLHLHLQSHSDIIPIGNDGAICVTMSEKRLPIGIVIPSEHGPACISCKHQKYTCAHVQCVQKIIQDPEDVSDIPDIYLNLKSPAEGKKSLPTLMSTKRIPFILPNSLKSVISTPYSVRFKMSNDGICQLMEDQSTPCELCGRVNWGASDKIRESIIITQNRSFKALS